MTTEEEFEEMLEELRHWDVLKEGIKDFLEYARDMWTYKDMVEIRGDWYRFVTGGLSDNEAIIEAMKENPVAFILSWYSSMRGGVHIFNTGRFTEENPFYKYVKENNEN